VEAGRCRPSSITSRKSRAQIDRLSKEKVKTVTTSNLFGLNFLQQASGGRSTPIVGHYDPQSQTWGRIVTASAGDCASECFNCCGNSTGTSDTTVYVTRWTTYGSTDVITNTPGGGTDYATDDEADEHNESDMEYD
jgi:hypothetical protein